MSFIKYLKIPALIILPSIFSSSLVYHYKNTEIEKIKIEKNHYQNEFINIQKRFISHTNDTLAEYITNLKEHNSAQLRNNRSEAMAAADKIAMLSGRLQTLGIGGVVYYKSEVCYNRFAGGRVSDKVLQSDKDDMHDTIATVSGKASRMIAWRNKIINSKFNDPIPDPPK